MNPTNRTGSTHIGTLFKPFQEAIAQDQARKKRTQVKPAYARFKCKLYYRDGNASVHFSYDFFYRHENKQKIRVHDEAGGYLKLLNLIRKMIDEDKIISAVIWACLTEDTSTDQAVYNFQLFKAVRGKNPESYQHIRFDPKGMLKLQLLKA